jgi:hypothetical protein
MNYSLQFKTDTKLDRDRWLNALEFAARGQQPMDEQYENDGQAMYETFDGFEEEKDVIYEDPDDLEDPQKGTTVCTCVEIVFFKCLGCSMTHAISRSVFAFVLSATAGL